MDASSPPLCSIASHVSFVALDTSCNFSSEYLQGLLLVHPLQFGVWDTFGPTGGSELWFWTIRSEWKRAKCFGARRRSSASVDGRRRVSVCCGRVSVACYGLIWGQIGHLGQIWSDLYILEILVHVRPFPRARATYWAHARPTGSVRETLFGL